MSAGNGSADPQVEEAFRRLVSQAHADLDAKITANHREVMRTLGEMKQDFGGEVGRLCELFKQTLEAAALKLPPG